MHRIHDSLMNLKQQFYSVDNYLTDFFGRISHDGKIYINGGVDDLDHKVLYNIQWSDFS